MIWALFGLMTAAALGLILWPLLRRNEAGEARAVYDLAVYRDQLSEIDRDRDNGLLSPEEAAEARVEIERRILVAEEKNEPAAITARRSALKTASVLALIIPIGAALIYSETGAPYLPGVPFASRGADAPATRTAQAAPGQNAELENMVADLAKRLALEPENTEGWLMLARSYRSLERLAEAINAYRQALNAGASPRARSEMGEVIVIMSDGIVVPAAHTAFERTLADRPGDPRARYFLGLARLQAGDVEGALDRWTALRADSPADAPWLDHLDRQIAGASAELGQPVPEIAAAPQPAPAAPAAGPRGPTSEDIAAAGQMSSEDRQAMIRGMVGNLAARLADNPDDFEGWMRLARSYGVLEDFPKARDAWARASALRPNDPDVTLGYASAIARATPAGAPLPEVRTLAERLLAQDPDRAEGLWFLGLAHARAGATDQARAVWQRLLDRLPPGTPARIELQQRLDALGG